MPQSSVEGFTREEVDDQIQAAFASQKMEGRLDESCQVIFDDVNKRSQTQCENIERRLQASLKRGLESQMLSITKSLSAFTVEAGRDLQRLASQASEAKKSGKKTVNFKASSATFPGDDDPSGGDGGMILMRTTTMKKKRKKKK